MKVYEILTEDGRIVKGVNTTVDVGVNQIPIEAKKMGFTVDKDGHPPTLSSKVKGKSTNVLFNLGLTESKMKLFKYFLDVTGRSAANKAPKRTVDPVTKYDPMQHKENFIQKQMAKGKTRAEAEAQANAMTKKGYFDPKKQPKEVPKTKVKQQDIDAFKVWLKKHDLMKEISKNKKMDVVK